MGDIIILDDHRPPPETNEVFALCVHCKTRWFASCAIGASLFKLECPTCGKHDSFPSFIPKKYLKDLHVDKEEEEYDG